MVNKKTFFILAIFSFFNFNTKTAEAWKFGLPVGVVTGVGVAVTHSSPIIALGANAGLIAIKQIQAANLDLNKGLSEFGYSAIASLILYLFTAGSQSAQSNNVSGSDSEHPADCPCGNHNK